MKADLFVEFNGNRFDSKALMDAAKEIWKNDGNKVKDLETLQVFLKPEESKCYYVMNGTKTGSFDV